MDSSIKITNEPPTGMMANIHKALDNFNQETLEMCSKEAEFKAILFSLCYFHASIQERSKFGAQGWNRSYPFNVGDLTISVNVLYNYLEANNKVPWEDLRYLFGEIMYGGHITDDWDRRLCRTFLEVYMNPDLVCCLKSIHRHSVRFKHFEFIIDGRRALVCARLRRPAKYRLQFVSSIHRRLTAPRKSNTVRTSPERGDRDAHYGVRKFISDSNGNAA